MERLKRHAPLILLLVPIIIFIAGITPTSEWRTGNFCDGYSGYTTVYLTNPQKPGRIRVHTYICALGDHHTGACLGSEETSTRLRLKLYDQWGEEICEFNVTSKAILELGADHDEYRVSIACRQDLESDENNNYNREKCVHWAIETIENTQFLNNN